MAVSLKSNGVQYPGGETQTGSAAGYGGQSWSYVSRSVGTSYQNTTGQTICVGLTGDKNGVNGGDLDVSPDNSTFYAVCQSAADNGWGGGQAAVVPPGYYYRTGGSYNNRTWAELR